MFRLQACRAQGLGVFWKDPAGLMDAGEKWESVVGTF